MQSQDHIRIAHSMDPSQQTLPNVKAKMSDLEKAAYKTALTDVYWLASEEIPNSKYPSLLRLERHLGLKEAKDLHRGGNCKKESPSVFNDMLEALSQVSMVLFTQN